MSDKPKHYKEQGVDTFTRLEHNASYKEIKGFIKGNIDKYNWREKEQNREDYQKIIQYALYGIRQLDKHNASDFKQRTT